MPLKEIEVATENRNNHCNPDAPNGCQLLHNSLNILFRQCEWTVYYDIIICNTPGFPTITVFNVNYDSIKVSTDTACINVIQGITALDPREGYNALYAYVAGRLVKHNVDSLNNIDLIPLCGSGITTRITLLSNSCYQYCERYTKNGLSFIDEVDCGDGCCQRTDFVCKGIDGQINYAQDPSPGSAVTINVTCSPIICNRPLSIPNAGCTADCKRLNDVAY